MTMHKTAAHIVLLTLSLVISVLLCELVARLVLHPADYLGVEMVKDQVLGAVPSSHTREGGFDSWGFRNDKVPNKVDIVAIGDSHTYGNTATMANSWPYVLGRLTGRSVYNMGLGGYGPNQYFALLPKALTLKPKIVICGLYMGDDFENAFLITYGLQYWAYLRELHDKNVDPDIWPQEQVSTWHKALRVWLSRYSVAYQLLFHGPLMGLVQGEYQITHAAALFPSTATVLSVPDKHILEAFLPIGILHRLNQDSVAVREGMRISFTLLKQMHTLTCEHGSKFLVVVIPTKESVFADYIEKRNLPLREVLDRVIYNERLARKRTVEFLTASGIPYVDVLPALQASIGQQLYARTASDIHPNKNGYRVIAETVFDCLNRMPALEGHAKSKPQKEIAKRGR